MPESWFITGGLVLLALLPAIFLGYILPAFLGVPFAAAGYWLLGSSMYQFLPGATQSEFAIGGRWAAAGAGVAALLGAFHGRAVRRSRTGEAANGNHRQGEGRS